MGEICWNERCIGDAGGVCNYLMSECIVLKIELNRSVFKKSIRQIKKDTKLENGGIQCDNLLSCLQLTFEHEMDGNYEMYGVLGISMGSQKIKLEIGQVDLGQLVLDTVKHL